MANVTLEPIFQVANGFMAATHLFIANEVGLFDAHRAAFAALMAVALLLRSG